MIPGAIKMLSLLTKGALRQTKRLSAFQSTVTKGVKSKVTKLKSGKFKTGTGFGAVRTKTGTISAGVYGGQLRPWAKHAISGLRKTGLSATKTRQALYGYQRGYKHLKKHKKLYGAGAGGAVIWDMMDDD
jgi:hypothetical protein